MAKHARTDAVQRTKRTAVAVVLGALVVLVGVLPEVLTILADELGGVVPEHLRLWLLGAAAAVAAVSTAVTKIMGLAGVDRLLSLVGLGKAPDSPEVV
ncbi:hypothetical protein [Pseudomonas sp.]|uniref:hypothetical protein n=1 Tax=Pseudomonas sp. TaxID=306 RepID=UPI0026187B4A|nr:hypothetical protein [Pseudomonas sp.]